MPTTVWRRLAAPLLAAAVALPALPAAAQGFDPADMSETERAAFGAAVRAYILENPGVIREAVEALQARESAAQAEEESRRVRQYMAALHDTSYAWAGGDADGDVTVVEFLDYRCGYCKRAHPAVKEALESDGDFRLIVREYPILGPESVAAGKMAMAAYRIDAALYPVLSDALMEFQGQLDETSAYRIAERVGYDVAELKALAGSEEIDAKLAETYRLAEALGVRGTPTFVIGDRIVRGAVPAGQLVAMIAAEREERAAD